MADEQKDGNTSTNSDWIGCIVLIFVFLGILYSWQQEKQCKPYVYAVDDIITITTSDIVYSSLYEEIDSVIEKKEHCDNSIHISFEAPILTKGLTRGYYKTSFRIKITKIKSAYSYVGSVQKTTFKKINTENETN